MYKIKKNIDEGKTRCATETAREKNTRGTCEYHNNTETHLFFVRFFFLYKTVIIQRLYSASLTAPGIERVKFQEAGVEFLEFFTHVSAPFSASKPYSSCKLFL